PMTNLSKSVAIVGVAESDEIGKVPHKSSLQHHSEAAYNALEDAGLSTLGNPMKVVVLTSPENQARLPRLREVARRLADPRGLTPAESAELVDEGAVIALVTCSIHSTEVGSTQMVSEFVHD
ncbi:hypothetical protein LCGC14_3122680, partial [marine sediment metagenome]